MPDYTPPSGGSGSGISEAEAITAVQGEATLDLTGDVTVAAGKDFTVDTDTLHVDSTNDRVGIGTTSPSAPLHVVSDNAITGLAAHAIVESTDDAGAYGPVLNLYRNSASPADGDFVGMIRFNGQNSNGDEHMYAQIYTKITDQTNATEDASLNLQAIHAGSETGRITIGNDITINGNLANSDFMVHGDTQVYVLFVDAGQDSVGIRTGTPVATLDVASGQTFRSTRLLTVSLSSNTTLSESSHAGRYIFVTGSSRVITLPDNQGAGVHFTILSNDANGFLRTGTGSSDGDNMNGAQTDITVSGRDGVTAISTGTDYVVLGV